MKQLTCEMCGSTDLLKQDGVFICQSCGTKYSIEEAKKMMVEGTVDVSGSTIIIDTSEKLNNLYQLARRAKDANIAKDAAKYYDLILQEDPNSWEAAFYSVFFKAASCAVAQIEYAAKSIEACLNNTFAMISRADEITQEQARIEVCARVLQIADAFCEAAKNSYQSASSGLTQADRIYGKVMADFSGRVGACSIMLMRLGSCLGGIYDVSHNEEDKQRMLMVSKKAVSIYYPVYSLSLYRNNPNFLMDVKKVCAPFEAAIKRYEPEYKSPFDTAVATGGGGCYIATTVYGSYDCPQVWTLRRYRDYTLAETWYGRAFIRTYYAVSPTLVKWFGHTDWFKNMWKPKLDRLVEKLNQNGVDSTPYQDRNWQGEGPGE